MKPTCRSPHHRSWFLRSLASIGWLSALLTVETAAAQASLRQFDLPADDATVSLKAFAEQSGQEIVYPPDVVRGTRTNAVKGEFTPKIAIDRMLAGTALVATQSGNGLLSVSRAGAPNGTGAGPTRSNRARDS